jgi:hypothetical protein
MASTIEDLGEAAEEGVKQAWIEEAQHRYEEIRRGDVEVTDSDEVFREARARLGDPGGLASAGEAGALRIPGCWLGTTLNP